MFSKRTEELGDVIANKARECAQAIKEVLWKHQSKFFQVKKDPATAELRYSSQIDAS